MGEINKRLEALGLVIPEPARPVANYVGHMRCGDLIFTAGQLPVKDGHFPYTGQVGTEVSLEDAIEAARLCAINIISHVREACSGDLDRVRRCVKLTGFVSSGAGFADQPKVINGASDMMVAVFGEKGKHARSAIGVSSLPLNVSVEIEAIFEAT